MLPAILFCAFIQTSCSEDSSESSADAKKSIVILYENDVHCGIDGYTRFVGLRDAILRADTSYVGLVSSGDFIQGALAGAISHGKYIIDIMKNVGYDAITLGNHEFDYGVPRMFELLRQINAPVICSNFFEYGGTEPIYKPYVIKQYGSKRIAFVGTLTPTTMNSEAYAFYDENKNQKYDLRTNEVYSLVQKAVDNARSEGADYVVVLSHLGEAANELGIDSHGLVNATNGIDVVLDGHTHSVIPCDFAVNKDGKMIPITQTGTQFANVGKLWISQEGRLQTSLISDIPYTNDRITATVDSIKVLLDEAAGKQVATSDFDLLVKDASGEWIVRKQETNLGDLVADAYRHNLNADIGLVNAGGVRNDIKAGTITYGDIVSIQPNDNNVNLIEITGAEILAMLTKCTAKCPQLDGSFPQVSGMKFTIHTASHTVSDVVVLNSQTNSYDPIVSDKKYTIAVTDYHKTGGFYRTMENCLILTTSTVLSRDIVADYLTNTLGGKVSDTYRTLDRITIIND